MKKYTPEQIVWKLRHADRELGKGQTVKEVCRTIEISEQTYYRWRQKYGGMSPEPYRGTIRCGSLADGL